MTMITPSYLGETIEYSSLHACRSTLEDPTFVTRTDGEVAGWVDRCPHAGMPLSIVPDRYLTREGDLILCASHGALFRPADGHCVGGPCAGKALTPWPIRIEGEVVVTA